MKHLWVRLVALACAVLLLIPCLVGCGGDGGDGGEKGKAEKLPDENVVDTKGYEFVVWDYFKTRWQPEAGIAVNDKILKIMDDVQELYNCKIVFNELNVNEAFTKLQPEVAAGGKFGDLVITTMWNYGKFLGADLMGDLKQVPGLNLDKPYWNQRVMDTMTLDGKVLGGGASFTDHSYLTWSCYFNKTMLQQLGHDENELYNLVREGKWTYDKFLSYAKEALADLDASGVMDSGDDRWGLVAPGGDYNRAAYMAMGGKFYDHDDKGKLVLSCDTQHAYDVVDFMRKMFKTDKIWMDSADESFQDIMTHFVDGHSLFIMCSPGEDQLRSMEDDFGFLPQPKWNEEQEDYIGMVDHNAPLFGITNTNTTLDMAGPIMEAIARRYEAVNILTLDNWRDSVWRSEADDEMMRNYVYLHGGYDLAPIAQNAKSQLGLPMNWVHQATMGTNTDYSSTVEQVKDALQTIVDEFVYGEGE